MLIGQLDLSLFSSIFLFHYRIYSSLFFEFRLFADLGEEAKWQQQSENLNESLIAWKNYDKTKGKLNDSFF